MVDKVTSPAGEEFELADESANRVLVKGVVAVLDHRTQRLYSVKEGDMFLFADAAGNLDAEEAIGAGLYYKDTRFLSDYVLTVDGRTPLLLLCPRAGRAGALADAEEALASSGAEGWRVRSVELARVGAQVELA